MIEWRNLPSKRMISPPKDIGFFQRKNVGGLLYDAEQLCRARRIRAYLAYFAGGKKSAQLAGTNRLAGLRDSPWDLFRLIAPCSHHPERNPLRRARTHSRHLSQLRNQIPDCNRIFRPSQSALSLLPTAIRLAAEQAAPTAANRIAVRDRLLPRDHVPSEIQNKLPPNAFLDRELRRSRKNLYARHARVWLPWQRRVARRFQVDRANSLRSRNRLDARRPFRSRYRKWAYQ